MPRRMGEHIRSTAMKNLVVWTVLIVTAAFGVAVAQPSSEYVAVVPMSIITSV